MALPVEQCCRNRYIYNDCCFLVCDIM